MTDRVFNVLFLCTGNSARSILAEAIMNRLGQCRFRGLSAGSDPRGAVQPMALEILASAGHDLEGLRSKNWSEFARPDSPRIDFVITLCDEAAAESCPVWPGHPISTHWGMPDPARAEGDESRVRQAYENAYRVLTRRIAALIELPVASLPEPELRLRLQEIGKLAG